MKKQAYVCLEEMMPLIEEALGTGQSIRIHPYGISMLPMLHEGRDSVVLSSVKKIKKYDIILYQREKGKYVLHRVVGVGDTYTCIGDNQYVLEKGIAPEQVIAVCTAFTRNGRDYSADSFKWRFYAVIWHYSRFPRRVLRGVRRRIIRLFGKK